jgi:hypothetical protein
MTTSRTITSSPHALISSVRIETDGGPHARLFVFTHGQLAGVLMVDRGDAEVLAHRLVGGMSDDAVGDGGW